MTYKQSAQHGVPQRYHSEDMSGVGYLVISLLAGGAVGLATGAPTDAVLTNRMLERYTPELSDVLRYTIDTAAACGGGAAGAALGGISGAFLFAGYMELGERMSRRYQSRE